MSGISCRRDATYAALAIPVVITGSILPATRILLNAADRAPRTEHWLPASTLAPPVVPRPVAVGVGPHQLQGANAGSEESDGEDQMDVGVIDLDDLKEELALKVDVYCRLQPVAVTNDLMRDGVPDLRARR